MPGHSGPSNRDEERAELEAVAAALSRSPRLVRLVRYLGEKYFLGEIDQLHEYNIATEVFERSKTVFDAGEDAIARVEAHRLRKRLKEFYESDGKDHPVQLVIPSGTYVPVFTRQAVPFPPLTSNQTNGQPGPPADIAMDAAAEPSEHGPAHLNSGFLRRLQRTRWFYPLLAATLLIAILCIYWVFRTSRFTNGTSSGSATAQPSAVLARASAPSGPQPVRLIAGYSGQPQMDSAGAIWMPDQYFYGGGSWSRPAGYLARTSDQLLFEQWRSGEFAYNIPLKPGIYELHLYFVTSNRASDTPASFSIWINGTIVLSGFDVNSDALGENIADERVFRDISPEADGYLHLQFTGERGTPSLNAIAILPGIPHKQLPIRLIAQTTPFTDHDGNLWHPDNYFMNGHLSEQRVKTSGSPDPDLFSGERYGHFTYAIPVDTRDRYTLVLHFAEFYFGPHASGVGGTGSRLFKVMCNGETLLNDFDIYKEADSLHVLTKTFYHLKPSAQGKLNLTFEPIWNNATVSGIEVLDESQ
ncbi:MAG: malectin domain-containing carbohydrate-binding protein [Terracidiphilus sp.]